MSRKHAALGALILAYVLLIPGVTQPLMTLSGSVDKAQLLELGKATLAENSSMMPMIGGMVMSLLDQLQVSGTVDAYEKTRSIVGTVSELFRSGNGMVGFLVMLFSIIIPVIKGLMMLTSLFWRHAGQAALMQRISGAISKWSMADVFVVAIVVAYLAANASQSMGEIFSLNAEFQIGFYFFLGYCLLSILSAQLLRGTSQD